MKSIEVQSLSIPCAFITGLSYAKTARTVADWRGAHRFQTFEAPEIALRLLITPMACSTIGESFAVWNEVLAPHLADVKAPPTTVYLAGKPLYASALFAVTAITRTDVRDGRGDLVSFEVDLTLSAVSVSKEASRVDALSFETGDLFPAVSISANGRTLPLGEGAVITGLTVTERGCEVSCSFDDGSKIVSRAVLTDLQKGNTPTVNIDDSVYYVFYSDLVDDVLSIRASVFPVDWNRGRSWTKGLDAPISLSDVFSGWADYTGARINFVQCRESLTGLITRLQDDLGFLIDYAGKTFRPIPRELNPTVDLDVFVSEDSLTEPISGLTWCDGVNSFFAGSTDGAIIYHKASIRVDGDPSGELLRFYRLVQNTIKVEMPIDPRIKQWSVVNIVKSGVKVPAMVAGYEKNYFSNMMQLELLS